MFYFIRGNDYALPDRMEQFRERFEHHLILKMRDDGIAEAQSYLQEQLSGSNAEWFACTHKEGEIAELHRFAAAGAAVRYMAVKTGKVADILALDIALRRNDNDWFEVLPPEIDNAILHKLYYGDFFCHVLHQDYIVKKGYNTEEIKSQMLKLLDERGARYPAEHNVGHLYAASEEMADFYQHCDPTNSLNLGIGKMSKCKHYT